jgi:hypothetical protein
MGAAFIVFVPDVAGAVNPALTELIYAGTLITLVMLAPAGIAGALSRVRVPRRLSGTTWSSDDVHKATTSETPKERQFT